MNQKTALITVYNKEGIIEFSRELANAGYRILSTGGTASVLQKNNIPVTMVSEYTGHPEILDGRVKTLHPKIFGGILGARNNQSHQEQQKQAGIWPFDLIVVNLYPLEERVVSSAALHETLEAIDIGGHSLLRAAAKNYKDVTLVIDPADYPLVLDAIKNNTETENFRAKLAAKALLSAARYDTILSRYFANNFLDTKFPDIFNLTFTKIQDLRYGENPHQEGAFYRSFFVNEACVSTARQIGGKQLSYNNILDANDGFELIKDFKEPTAAIIKHTNPSGVASAQTIAEAFKKAFETDPVSAYGSIIALNMPCTRELVENMGSLFVEVLICPAFEKDALELLAKKKNLRLLETGPLGTEHHGLQSRSVVGGMLIQTRDLHEFTPDELKVVSKRAPTPREIQDMLFATKVTKHTKSNSIVCAKDKVTVGVGAGQMSRVDAVKLAIMKSGGKCHGSVMSSDAYFPFRDGIDEAARAGITAVIQTGGSIRDAEVIAAADEHGMAMVFTGTRLFKH